MKKYIVSLVSIIGLSQIANAALSQSNVNYDLKLVRYLIKKGIIKQDPSCTRFYLNDKSETYNLIQQSIEIKQSESVMNCTGGGDL